MKSRSRTRFSGFQLLDVAAIGMVVLSAFAGIGYWVNNVGTDVAKGIVLTIIAIAIPPSATAWILYRWISETWFER